VEYRVLYEPGEEGGEVAHLALAPELATVVTSAAILRLSQCSSWRRSSSRVLQERVNPLLT
jgi:hypothetical protein